jgi:hypothetical protein
VKMPLLVAQAELAEIFCSCSSNVLRECIILYDAFNLRVPFKQRKTPKMS